jgi:transcriptional regulator with XRE-family HTH domain
MDNQQGQRIGQARRRTGLTQREFALQLGKSESLISKLEQGERELNDVRLARAIAELAGVGVAWLLGLDEDAAQPHQRSSSSGHRPSTATVAYPSAEEWSDMLRRTFVLGGLAASLSTGLSPRPPLPKTGRVSSSLAADLHAVSASYRRAYRTAPAQRLYAAVHEHMQLVLSLRPGDQVPAVRRELLVTAGEMAAVSGCVLGLDLGRWSDVGPYLDLAYRAAREAADPELETVVWACRAFQAAYGQGNKRLGVDFADAAVTAGRGGACDNTRAWAAAVLSERHADLGDEVASRRRLDQAQAALARDRGDRYWSGIGAFNPAKLTAYEGGNNGRLGHYDPAVDALSTALIELDPSMVRHRCTALIDRAEAHHGNGDVDAACADARAALTLVAETQHTDTVRRVEKVARSALATHANAARHLWHDFLAVKAATRTGDQ